MVTAAVLAAALAVAGLSWWAPGGHHLAPFPHSAPPGPATSPERAGISPKSVINQARARQRRRHRRIIIGAGAGGAAAGRAAAGSGSPPRHHKRSRSHRGRGGGGGGTPPPPLRADALPGLAELAQNGVSRVVSLSCPSAGNCTAGGTYVDSQDQPQAFVASQAHGTWSAEEVPGTAALNTGGNAGITALSCPSAGNCLAGGYYTADPLRYPWTRAFLIVEQDGIWGRPQPVPGLPAATKVTAVSCASAGNCGVGGYYYRQGTGSRPSGGWPFVAGETNGTWSNAQLVPGLAALGTGAQGTGVEAISCASAGNCTAGGTYTNKTGGYSTFSVSETAGVWRAAQNIRGTAGDSEDGFHEVRAISCASAGNCGLAGSISTRGVLKSQAFMATQTGGTWGKAQTVPGITALNTFDAATTAVSCPAAGECTAGGYYTTNTLDHAAFIVAQHDGIWHAAQHVPGITTLSKTGEAYISSLTCASPANCTASGSFYTNDIPTVTSPFTVTQTAGTWHAAQEIGSVKELPDSNNTIADIDALSCPPAGPCVGVGTYTTRRYFNFTTPIRPGSDSLTDQLFTATSDPGVANPPRRGT
jgi:hypothetical protein